MSKCIIAGSRDFGKFNEMEFMKYHLNKLEFITKVVCGEARGADSLGKKWAIENNIPVKSFPADWEKYGRAAGHIRNAQMASYADMLVVFWDGKSPGTKNMIKEANKKNLEIIIYRYDKIYETW